MKFNSFTFQVVQISIYNVQIYTFQMLVHKNAVFVGNPVLV